jgi:alpha-galactosidase
MKAYDPPMGWNSWDSYLTTITEKDVLANAAYMHDHLLTLGWNTVVIDASWFDSDAKSGGYNNPDDGARFCLDGYGRQIPSPVRFPSAADGKGFGPLADKIHALGLRFGVHVMRGIPRQAVHDHLPVKGTIYTAADIADTEPAHLCGWNSDNYGLDHAHPGAQAWYDSQVDLLASWGVDFLKVDDMQAPFYPDEIASYAAAIRTAELKYGRPITLSLSPGTQVSVTNIDFLRAHAQMWRISDDLWDRWDDVHAQFARLARWAPLQRRGHWADADMLPLGHLTVNDDQGGHQSNLGPEEQKTLLTLWSMAHSPLMMGGDLPTSDSATLRLLENPWISRVERTAGVGREIVRELYGKEDCFNNWSGKEVPSGEFIVWTADGTDCAADAAGPAGGLAADGKTSGEPVTAPVVSGVADGLAPHYAALFWTGPTAAEQNIDLASLVGLDGLGHRWAITDLWQQDQWVRGGSGKEVPANGADTRPAAASLPASVRLEGRLLFARIPAHGVVWLRLDPMSH